MEIGLSVVISISLKVTALMVHVNCSEGRAVLVPGCYVKDLYTHTHTCIILCSIYMYIYKVDKFKKVTT